MKSLKDSHMYKPAFEPRCKIKNESFMSEDR